jgi:HlyD family secretion protein
VLSRTVEPGQIVQVGRALMTLALAGPLQLVAPVDERYLQQLQVGQAAWVLADAFPEQRFRARVLSIAPLVDAQRGSVEVKFSVDQPPPFLREDMSLSVEVETARRESALVVPLSALRASPGDAAGGTASAPAQATLWLEKAGRVEARAVRLGLRTLESVEVVQGLAAGDVVLLGPAPTPGRRVKAATAAPLQARGKAKSDDAGSALGNAMGR